MAYDWKRLDVSWQGDLPESHPATNSTRGMLHSVTVDAAQEDTSNQIESYDVHEWYSRRGI